jgi:hypothetical protein
MGKSLHLITTDLSTTSILFAMALSTLELMPWIMVITGDGAVVKFTYQSDCLPLADTQEYLRLFPVSGSRG